MATLIVSTLTGLQIDYLCSGDAAGGPDERLSCSRDWSTPRPAAEGKPPVR